MEDATPDNTIESGDYKTIIAYTDEDILHFEQSAEDVIGVRRAYIDMCGGDINTALLLSQIRYWHMPNKSTGKSKLRIEKEGVLWIAKKREDWWDEIRLTSKQVDRSIKLLVDLSFIEKKIFKFDGNPTIHVRALLSEIHQMEISIYTGTVNPILPSGVKTILPPGVNSLTGTTTKITTGTVKKFSPTGKKLAEPSKPKPNGGKIKQSIKIIKNKKKYVSEVEEDVENNMSIATIKTLVADFNKKPKVAGNLSEFWVRCLRAEYPGMGFDLVSKLIPADTKKLRMATEVYKGELYNTLGMVLENWVSFTEHAKIKHGAFGLPQYPTINFLLQWKDAVLSFKVVSSGEVVAVSKPQVKKKKPSMPVGKELL